MKQLADQVRRLPLSLGPDPRRVLIRPFAPSLVVKPTNGSRGNRRLDHLCSRIMMLNDGEVEAGLAKVLADFADRHPDLRETFARRFEDIRSYLPTDRPLSESRQLLLGSYFINEYSVESSALFNPSIVPAPDQSGLAPGEQRFILSLRATGEGHISSVTFRSGVLSADADVRLDPVSRFVRQPDLQPAARYDLKIFRRKLQEDGVGFADLDACTRNLPPSFLMRELEDQVRRLRAGDDMPGVRTAAERALMLAQANYTVRFPDGVDISEKILFPYARNESNGIEDARFVRFVDDDGTATYHATYTAYNGSVTFPQLVTTTNFQEFDIRTLNGAAVRNKGLALFPRKIHGHYAMLGRQDGENIRLMFSDYLHFWHDARVILRPSEPWEFVQLGNCGSPLETEAGWLVLTHGVGPMRTYCIGAVLLDRDDPSRVLGRLRQPLLWPQPDEREGYVPNVVYSCGALIHAGQLVLPYAVSDTSTRFALVPLAGLLAAMA